MSTGNFGNSFWRDLLASNIILNGYLGTLTFSPHSVY